MVLMMKKACIFLLMLLVLPIVYAAELFNGDVVQGETYEAGDHTFNVKYSLGNAKLVFEVDDLREILELGECAYRDNLKVCFDDVELSVMEEVEKLTVSVFDLVPSITITRSFSDTSVVLEEDIEVEVTLTNGGDTVATNVVFTDSYPISLEVRNGENNKAVWTGSISPGETESIKYKLRAKSIVEYESVAEVSHIYEGNKITTESDSETIEVSAPYGFEVGLDKDRAKRNEVVVLNITFENKDENDDLKINSLVIEPSYLLKVKEFSDDLKEDGVKYTYSGSINEESSKSFMIKVYSGRNAEHYIDVSTDFRIGSMSLKEDIIKELEVGLSSVYPIINLTLDRVLAGDILGVAVRLKNDGIEDVSGVNVKIESDLFNTVESKDNTITAGASKDVLANKPTAPEVESETTYNIKVIGSYVEDGQTYAFEKNAKVVVVPTPKVVSMLHELDKEEYNVGEEVNVVVSIENIEDSAFDKVSLIEMLPNEVKSSLKGDILVDTSLAVGEKKEAYSYSFAIPADYQKETLNIRTIVNVKKGDNLYKYDWSKQVKVTGIQDIMEDDIEDEAEEQPVDDVLEDNLTEANQEKQKEGFFKKIIDFFIGLFNRSPPEEQE